MDKAMGDAGSRIANAHSQSVVYKSGCMLLSSQRRNLTCTAALPTLCLQPDHVEADEYEAAATARRRRRRETPDVACRCFSGTMIEMIDRSENLPPKVFLGFRAKP